MEINSNNFNDAMNCNLTINTDTGFYVGDLPPTHTGTEMLAVYTYPINDYYWNWYYPNCHIQRERSKVDLAFKILKVLSDKKLINLENLTVRRFITIVNDLSKEL